MIRRQGRQGLGVLGGIRGGRAGTVRDLPIVRWVVVLLALGLGLAVATDGRPFAALEGGRCVWVGGDSDAVDRFLRDWSTANGGGAVERWDILLTDHVARLDLRTERGAWRIPIALGARCDAPPAARLADGVAVGGFPGADHLAALATGFPAGRRQLAVAPQRGPEVGPARLPFVVLAFLCIGLAALGQRPAALDGALVLALVGLAAWPLLFEPFDTDAPIMRAAAISTDIFSDRFHPFLPFLLSRPPTWFAFEPWSLRLVPLLVLGLETLLLMRASGRQGGRLAAALAGVWFACEVRRRHGLRDLSDWDFAGTALVCLLLILQSPRAASWRGAALLAATLCAGLASSYLMIVPAGVLIGSIGLDVLRRRWPPAPAAALAALGVGLAIIALGVFGAGSQVAAEIDSGTLWEGMYDELPAARLASMALPLLLGLAWLMRHLDRAAPRFAAGCLVAVPLAVAVAHRHSHVAGGYYIGLVTPLLLWAAAVASAAAIARLAAAAGERRGAAAAGLALLVALATVGGDAPGLMGPTGEPLHGLAAVSRDDGRPIHSNRPDLGRLLSFERARLAGGGLRNEAVMWGPPDVRDRLLPIAAGACPPTDAGPHFAVWYREPDALRRCIEPLGARCRSLLAAADSDWIVMQCEG